MITSEYSRASEPQPLLWLGPIPVLVRAQATALLPLRDCPGAEGAAAGMCPAEIHCCVACGEGEECFICTVCFQCLLLNNYWWLLVVSVCFNLSPWVGVSEESSLQALSWQ